MRDERSMPLTQHAIWTVNEVSAHLNVKPKTIYAWKAQGRIPGGFKLNGLLRFHAEQIERWVAEQASEEQRVAAPTVSGRYHGSLDAILARAKREAYSACHGETRPELSLTGKEGDDGAR